MAVDTLAFHITDRCQLDCKHCLRDPGQRPVDLDFDLFVRVLDEVTRVYRSQHVALTGGEPTLHPRFVEMIDAIAARGLTWHMVTNGKNFPWLMERFTESPTRRGAMSRVYLSVDGADEATHDRIRGPGSFREVMRACALASAHDTAFVTQMAVNAYNEHHVESFGLLASQLGAARASFAILQPTGTPHDCDLYLPASAWRGIRDRIDRLASSLTMPVTMPEGWPQALPFHVCAPFRSELLHVDVRGHLNLCCQQAGIPQSPNPPSGESDVAADLRTSSVVEGHSALLGIIHRAQEAKLRAIAASALDEWDFFPCNWCLKHFGKPHWGKEGNAGPEAARERWVGAWGELKGQSALRTRLPLLGR